MAASIVVFGVDACKAKKEVGEEACTASMTGTVFVVRQELQTPSVPKRSTEHSMQCL